MSTSQGKVPLFDPSGRRKYLNKTERKACLHVIHEERDLARRTFMLTVFHTGCRISEALNLLAARIDDTSQAVVFETLKRRKRGCYRAVPIPEPLMQALLEVSAGKPRDARVWSFSRSTAYRMIKAKMHEAKITGAMAMPKGLRHGHAVACVSANIPLPMIKRWLGHSSIETTALYLDLLGDEEQALANRLWMTDL